MALSLAIIAVSLNEAGNIEALLTHLSASGADEIILVDGGSTDGTVSRAKVFPDVKIIETAPGRGVQMNAGAAASRSDILLFLHSDVRLDTDAVPGIRAALRNPRIAGGNLDIRYEGGDLAAWAFTLVNRMRLRFGGFYGDSGIWCRREVFESLGGYKNWPIMEDYEFARRLLYHGQLSFLKARIHVSDRRWRKAGAISTLFRWVLIQGLYTLGVPPSKLSNMYRMIR